MDLYIWQSVRWCSDASFVLVLQVKDNARSASGGFYPQHHREGCLCLRLLLTIYLFIYKMHPVKNPLVHSIIYWILLSFILLIRGQGQLLLESYTGVSPQHDYCMQNGTFCQSDENLYLAIKTFKLINSYSQAFFSE